MLAAGRRIQVEVPATSANLGPGFDCFGLALDWYDSIALETTRSGYSADISGAGAADLPKDERHLVIHSALVALQALGVEAPGLHLTAHNTIPHGRGLGSSSAAIVSGLLAAVRLADSEPDLVWLADLADEIEGHPDNVAAAVYGGLVLAYQTDSGLRVARGRVRDDIEVVVFVPDTPMATKTARELLPDSVPRADATANAGRAALLIHALSVDPSLLFDATEDWLHQGHRSVAMPESAELLRSLRGKGLSAVISGAGPTVLVLGTAVELEQLGSLSVAGFDLVRARPGHGARAVETV